VKLRQRKHLRYTRRAQAESWFASWCRWADAYLGPRPSETGRYL
jgi:hypothetical protein